MKYFFLQKSQIKIFLSDPLFIKGKVKKADYESLTLLKLPSGFEPLT